MARNPAKKSKKPEHYKNDVVLRLTHREAVKIVVALGKPRPMRTPAQQVALDDLRADIAAEMQAPMPGTW